VSGDNCLDLKFVRNELDLSQSRFADLLGVSARTVQACEQGWRNPSAAVEKSALLLLLAKRHGEQFREFECWSTMNCSGEKREKCLAYLTHQGHLCWLLSGNICQGRRVECWADKKAFCEMCAFFKELLPQGLPKR
jgi:DNA-binding XRE family transcriptional regulator